MKALLAICIASAFLAFAASGATFQGQTRAEFKGKPDGKHEATLVHHDLELLRYSDVEGPKHEFKTRSFMLESERQERIVSGTEGRAGPSKLKALDPVSGKTLWTIEDRSVAHGFDDEARVVWTRSESGGGSAPSYRAYGALNGKYLFPYSFFGRDGGPVLVTNHQLQNQLIRLIGYQDNYWPARDRIKELSGVPEGLKVGGVLTYASPDRALQRVAVLYDEKAANDPSEDPEEIVIRAPGGKEAHLERGKYFAGVDPTPLNSHIQDPKEAFNGMVIALRFGKEWVRIPVEKDELQVAKAETAKLHPKLLALP